MTTTVNPFLEGNFAPIDTEISADNLKVIGEIPEDLSGMLVRNGPNPQFTPMGNYHWFDGDGMLHGVHIHNGKASYINRYVQTQKYQVEGEANHAILTGLLEPPQPHITDISRNTANTALVFHAGELLALWEGGEPHKIKVPELATIGSKNYNGKLVSAFTAHPKVDPVSGEMMFFGYSFFTPPYLQYSVVSANGELLHTVPIDLPMGVMMHDFAITQNHTIFMDLPITFSMERIQQGKPALMFESDRPSRFGIVSRYGNNNNIRWFESPSCYIFHTLNAYEENEEVVLIACRMSSTNVFVSDQSQRHPDGDIPRLYEWRFNLKTGTVNEKLLDNTPSEFPRINEQLLGIKTQYGYTAKMAENSRPLFDGLIKYDFSNGKSETHKFGEGRYGGEAVFVPSVTAHAEDQGWLITFVRDEIEEVSELVIIDAQDVTAEPVARVIIPQRVPYGFHGIWINEAQLEGYI